MLPAERIPFGQWLPDRPDFPSHGALLAKNCIPRAESYSELRGLKAVTDAASGGVVGAIWVQDSSGTTRIIVGTPTTLLLLAGTSWTTVGSGYNVSEWEFCYFGDFVIAVAAGEAPQVIDLSAGSPAFAPLAGSPPNASRVAVVGDFVMLGGLDANERLIQWSGYNNHTIWDANGSTAYQADSQLIFTGGAVQKIVGGPVGYVFQEREIRVLEYVGPPVIFNIRILSRSRGCRAAGSVIEAGDSIFFLAQDGFFQLTGGQFNPIGEERVNRWFEAECAPDEIVSVRGAIDKPNRLALWAFKSISGGAYDRLLIYNYAADRWSYAETSLGWLFETRSPGYDLDTLATILTSGIDADSIPVESRAFLGEGLTLYGADTSGQVGAFDSDPLTATLDTREFDGPENTRRSITGVRPFVQGSPSTVVTVKLGRRNGLSDNVSFSSARSLTTIGEAPILSDARYHRVRVEIAGGFEHANGVDVLSRPSGRF